jgi:glyoxylase-like metal-dependent hydrolase (beta-lactamase superfamily II)
MDLVPVVPDLFLLQFGVGNAYLLVGADGLTLVDCGLPGSGPAIADAIRMLGHHPADLLRLVLTHFHADHAGAAAEITGWGQVAVVAHAAEAPVICGRQAGPPPDLAGWERPLFEQVTSQLPAAQPAPVPVAREVTDGDELDLGGRTATVLAVPGHTPGSIGLYFGARQLLLTGDTVARAPDGRVMPGVFNVDRPAAAASFRRLAALDADIACFGHGAPLTGRAGAILRVTAGLAGHSSSPRRPFS